MTPMSNDAPMPSQRRSSRRRVIGLAAGLGMAMGAASCGDASAPVAPAADTPPASALRFHNLTVATGDLARMTAWYETTLGFVVEERGRFDAVGADYAMMTGHGLRLEFISRGLASARPVDWTAPPGHLDVLGWKALVLEAEDLPGFTARLRAAGAEIVWADQQISVDRRSTLIRDPDGNLINIFGPRQGVQPSA